MFYTLPDELDSPPRHLAMEDDHTNGGMSSYHSPMMHTAQPDEDVIDGPAMDTQHDDDDDEDEGDDEEYDNEDDEEDGDETEAAGTTSPGGTVRGGTGGGAGGGEAGAATGTGGNAAGAAPGQAPVIIVPAVPNLDSLYGLREMGRDALCWRLSSAKPGNGVEQIRDHSTETYWQSDGTSQPHWIQVHFARRVAISHVCLYLDYNLDESYTPRRVTVQVGMTSQDLQPAILPRPTVIELHEPVGWCIIPLSSPPDTLDEYDRLADSFAEQNRVSDTHEGDDNDGVFDAAVLMEEDEVGSGGGTNPSSSASNDAANSNGTSRTSRRSGGNRSRRQKRNNQTFEEDATAKQEGLVKAHLIQISILAQHQNGRDTHVRQVQLYGPRMTATTAPQAKTLVERNMFPTRSSRYQFHGEDEFCTVAMSQYSTIR